MREGEAVLLLPSDEGIWEDRVIDTIRVLVSWKCNLTCSYCCNDQERFRKDITPTRLEDIDFSAYKVVCISGGEPLMFPQSVRAVCERAPLHSLVVLYTNGILLTKKMGQDLMTWGVDAINVGLHIESTFGTLIDRVLDAVPVAKVRFHAEDRHQWLSAMYPQANFRFWKMDDCDRDNERRVVLDNEPRQFTQIGVLP